MATTRRSRNPKRRELALSQTPFPEKSKKSRTQPSSASSSSSSREPYPDHPNPSPEQCRSVRDDLLQLHGIPQQFAAAYRQRSSATTANAEAISVLDGLISTLLSQNTTDANSSRAFQSLKSSFPTWQQVLDADPKSLEGAIRCGGLAATKAARIKSILEAVRDKRGEFCLEYLRGLPVDEVKAQLSRFKGIGPKTVACVLMFQLQKEDFPVDTHVFRIAKALGWIPMKADREKAYLHLNKRIPDELKFDLNCLLVTHGKLCERCVSKRGYYRIMYWVT
ncbi:putative DNA glycosylase At3g47830 isoform X2 [Asparagus officinalis]|uniref:putative DNA glycosylase At3g47830 isoform X2 n=1 Tax=Asparagus officinalis TaxID=4686 RepID=UPI00098E737B|nr:putative DNA glycosylase At3g47830 isoform X2 [Asparagus officinalis]